MSEHDDYVPLDDEKPTFSEQAFGSWGESTSSEIPVLYLSTHVRLSAHLDRHEISLVESISPVREILDPASLSFAELLQRDLEDYRVLHQLVPYLMGDRKGAIGFFPPLLAVLLPFEHGRPSSFPIPIEARNSEGGTRTLDLTAGDFFRFRRVTNQDGKPSMKRRSAELQWNKDRSRLVVIDGQHRAMALLAIYRTLAEDDRWKDRGTQYRHFYEERIRTLYKEKGMPELEVPLTVCVFPSLAGGDERAVFRAARQLFVDVNKEAKTPNRSRLILLSETDLSDIFTRSLLDEIRDARRNETPGFTLPLAVIEYDTPGAEGRDGRPIRRVCISNIQHLHTIVTSVIWGSKEWIINVTKPNERKTKGDDLFMQKQLGLRRHNQTKLIVDGVDLGKISEIRRKAFLAGQLEHLRGVFMDSWGRALIHIFSNLYPYSTFGRAADDFAENWPVVADAPMALAKEAFFDGVGTYWTLREMDEEWRNEVRVEPRDKQIEKKTKAPAASIAWEIIGKKEKEFESLVYTRIVGHDPISEDERKAAREVLEKSETQAVQRGIAMAFASLVEYLDLSHDSILDFSRLFVARLNEFFLDPEKPRRKYLLSRFQPQGDHDMAFYGHGFASKLDSKKWVNMRWLFLEAFFSSPHAWSKAMTDVVSLETLEKARNELVRKVRDSIRRTTLDEVLTANGFKKDNREGPEAVALSAQEEARILARYLEWFDIDLLTLTDSEDEGTSFAPALEVEEEESDDGEDVEDEDDEED